MLLLLLLIVYVLWDHATKDVVLRVYIWQCQSVTLVCSLCSHEGDEWGGFFAASCSCCTWTDRKTIDCDVTTLRETNGKKRFTSHFIEAWFRSVHPTKTFQDSLVTNNSPWPYVTSEKQQQQQHFADPPTGANVVLRPILSRLIPSLQLRQPRNFLANRSYKGWSQTRPCFYHFLPKDTLIV